MGCLPNAGRTSLPQLPRKLYDLTGRPVPGGYRRLYLHVIEGRIPAEQDNGRWYVADADVPAIAGALGMVTPTGVPKGTAAPIAHAA